MYLLMETTALKHGILQLQQVEHLLLIKDVFVSEPVLKEICIRVKMMLVMLQSGEISILTTASSRSRLAGEFHLQPLLLLDYKTLPALKLTLVPLNVLLRPILEQFMDL